MMRAEPLPWSIFAVELQAVAPELDRRRHYELSVGQDLLGDWIVEIRFGRIGARDQVRRRIAGSEDEARCLARQALRRRASAPRRIGVAYAEIRRFDPGAWLNG